MWTTFAPIASAVLTEGVTITVDGMEEILRPTTDAKGNFQLDPVPAGFPNLPGPVTGEKLPPGTKSALWSCNHGSALIDNGGTLIFRGNQTFNAGTVVFGEGGAIGLRGPTALTLGPDSIVRGKTGRIGASINSLPETQSLINQGRIAADVPGGTLTIVSRNFTNTGTIQEANGGKVVIQP